MIPAYGDPAYTLIPGDEMEVSDNFNTSTGWLNGKTVLFDHSTDSMTCYGYDEATGVFVAGSAVDLSTYASGLGSVFGRAVWMAPDLVVLYGQDDPGGISANRYYYVEAWSVDASMEMTSLGAVTLTHAAFGGTAPGNVYSGFNSNSGHVMFFRSRYQVGVHPKTGYVRTVFVDSGGPSAFAAMQTVSYDTNDATELAPIGNSAGTFILRRGAYLGATATEAFTIPVDGSGDPIALSDPEGFDDINNGEWTNQVNRPDNNLFVYHVDPAPGIISVSDAGVVATEAVWPDAGGPAYEDIYPELIDSHHVAATFYFFTGDGTVTSISDVYPADELSQFPVIAVVDDVFGEYGPARLGRLDEENIFDVTTAGYSENGTLLTFGYKLTPDWETQVGEKFLLAWTPSATNNAHTGAKVAKFTTELTGDPSLAINGPDDATHRGVFAIPPRRTIASAVRLGAQDEQFWVQPKAHFLIWNGVDFDEAGVENLGGPVQVGPLPRWHEHFGYLDSVPLVATHWSLRLHVSENDPRLVG